MNQRGRVQEPSKLKRPKVEVKFTKQKLQRICDVGKNEDATNLGTVTECSHDYIEDPLEMRLNCKHQRSLLKCASGELSEIYGNPRPNERRVPGWETFDKIMISYMREYSIPGCSLSLAHLGQTIYTQCYGQAAPNTLLGAHHMFRIASVSKVLTAIAVMKLWEDKKLQLNDRVFGNKGNTPQPVMEQNASMVTESMLRKRLSILHDTSLSLGSKAGCSFVADAPVRASVVIPLTIINGEVNILLIKRSQKVWAARGEMSLPGGMIEETDADEVEAAYREAKEEIGLERHQASVLATFKPMLGLVATEDRGFEGLQYLMLYPVVLLLPEDFQPQTNDEIEEIWKYPLKPFTDFTAVSRIPMDYRGLDIHVLLRTINKNVDSGEEQTIHGMTMLLCTVTAIVTYQCEEPFEFGGKPSMTGNYHTIKHIWDQISSIPMKRILPEFNPTVEGDRRLLRVTVKHLLQHSGGWDRDVVGDPCFWSHVATDLKVPTPVNQLQLITYMMSQKLQFTPGTKYAYSNFGYVVLGRVIEKKSEKSYEAYVQGLLETIGVTRMRLGKTKRQDAHHLEVEYFAGPDNQSVDSVYPGEGKVLAPYGGYSMEVGDSDGGWIANPTDLLKILHSIQPIGEGEKMLRPPTFKMMLAKPSYAKGSNWYGLGLDVSWYGKAWEHGGHIDGATGGLVCDKDKFSWAILCNYWPANSDYTSLVSYALKQVAEHQPIKIVNVPNADATSKDQKYLVKIRLPHQHFRTLHEYFHQHGYCVVWLNSYQFQGGLYLNVIWSKTNKTVELFYNLSADEFQKKIIWTKEHAGVPLLVDSYKLGDTLKHCILIETKPTNFVSWEVNFDISFDELTSKCQVLKESRLVLKCISCEHVDGVDRYAALFLEDIHPTWWKCDMDCESYQKSCDRQAHYGHMPSHVAAHQKDGQPRLCAVWANPGPYRYTSEHDLSKYRLLNDIALTSEAGFYPWCITGYEDEDDHKFAAVCVKKV